MACLRRLWAEYALSCLKGHYNTGSHQVAECHNRAESDHSLLASPYMLLADELTHEAELERPHDVLDGLLLRAPTTSRRMADALLFSNFVTNAPNQAFS